MQAKAVICREIDAAPQAFAGLEAGKNARGVMVF